MRRRRMQNVKLLSNRVVDGQPADSSRRCSQRVHARDDAELRNRRERQHQDNQNVTGTKQRQSSRLHPVFNQRADEKQPSAGQANPVESDERIADYDSGQLRRREHRKRDLRDDGQKDQPPNPHSDRKQHEKTQKAHHLDAK